MKFSLYVVVLASFVSAYAFAATDPKDTTPYCPNLSGHYNVASTRASKDVPAEKVSGRSVVITQKGCEQVTVEYHTPAHFCSNEVDHVSTFSLTTDGTTLASVSDDGGVAQAYGEVYSFTLTSLQGELVGFDFLESTYSKTGIIETYSLDSDNNLKIVESHLDAKTGAKTVLSETRAVRK